jgi:hypothetical protein
MQLEKSHFFLFPLYGHVMRKTHTDYFLPFPLFHLRTSLDALRFEFWPVFFWRDEPALFAIRLWPLHADESRVNAGDFWVSRYLFLSKRFETDDEFRYRLDPFLFRVSSGPKDAFGIGGLFELLAYDTDGTDYSLRLIPFVFGGSEGKSSSFAAIPFHYRKHYGEKEINYGNIWRYVFLSHHLEGSDGERHDGVLWKLYESTDNPNRPEYSELGILYRLFFHRTTETSSTLMVNPFYSYYRNETDDETQYSFLLSLYNYRSVGNWTTHTLFYFIRF